MEVNIVTLHLRYLIQTIKLMSAGGYLESYQLITWIKVWINGDISQGNSDFSRYLGGASKWCCSSGSCNNFVSSCFTKLTNWWWTPADRRMKWSWNNVLIWARTPSSVARHNEGLIVLASCSWTAPTSWYSNNYNYYVFRLHLQARSHSTGSSIGIT